jgi:hypothetical protein
MQKDKPAVIFYCVPDEMNVQAHFWDGASGLLCRPPKGSVSTERGKCPRHQAESTRAPMRSRKS